MNRAQRFADQLTDYEQNGDLAAFVSAVFSPEVELARPETGRELSGHDGARTFWQEYLDRFAEIHSTFSRVHDGDIAVLEWSSTGRLPAGTDLSYRGVSLLDFDDDGRVTRFATYYDTSVFQPR